MLTSIDHVLFVVLALLFPLWSALFGTRRLKRAAPGELPRARLWLYRRAIIIQWSLTAAVLVLWAALGRPWASYWHGGQGGHADVEGLGVVPFLSPGLIGVIAGVAIVTVAILRQRAQALRDDETLSRVRSRLGRLELMLPHSSEELRWFYRLSITAGVCEEALYRGYLIWYLGHAVAVIPAVLAAGLLFGLGHAYQGVRGMFLTAAVGVFLGAVYALTGSLYAGMVIHALMDAHSGHLGYAALMRGRSELDEAIALAGVTDSEATMPAHDGPPAPAVPTIGGPSPSLVDPPV